MSTAIGTSCRGRSDSDAKQVWFSVSSRNVADGGVSRISILRGLAMANELTKLAPHIEQARTTLSQTADAERSLVQNLSDELKRFDHQTLHGIRTVAAEHEARRTGILNALQALADSIGMFQPQHGDALPKPVALPQPVARPPTAAAIPEQVDYGYQYTPPGDWRQATKNVNLQDDLEALLNGLNGKGPKN